MGIPTPTPPPYPSSRAQLKAQRAQWKMQRAYDRASYRGASRGSVVGPLLLLVIGVIALLMTLHRISAVYFWRWYGHWWPLVLIGAGVVLALESLLSSGRSRVRLGGGVVLLGVILVLLGLAAAHGNANWTAIGEQLDFGNSVNLSQMFGKKHEASEQIAHALLPNATLIVQNPRGDVTIAAGKDDQMHLSLNKTVYSNSDSEATQRMQTMEPLITSSGSVVTVHMPSSDRQIADMSITLPANAAVQVHAYNGDVIINGRQAAVAVYSNHGDVQLASIVGAVRAAMHQGDLSANDIQGDMKVSGHMNDLTLSQVTGQVALDGDFFGNVHLERLRGPVHFHSSRTDLQVAGLDGSVTLDSGDLMVDHATAPVGIATRNKDIELRHVAGDLRVRDLNGEVNVKALDPLGAMNIETLNGSVQVTVPENAKFSVEATAVDGEIHTDFNLSTQNANQHSIASGSVGGGGPLLHITAEKGDISIHKSGASHDE